MRKVIVDTNLLCLVVVGDVDRSAVSRQKRLSQFSPEDCDAVVGILRTFEGLIVCPHVLSETSNIVRLTAEPLKSRAGAALRALIEGHEERSIEAVEASRHRDYLRLGLTDAVLLTIAQTGGTLFTTDLDLYLAASATGHEVLNYNHIRDFDA